MISYGKKGSEPAYTGSEPFLQIIVIVSPNCSNRKKLLFRKFSSLFRPHFSPWPLRLYASISVNPTSVKNAIASSEKR